MKVWKLISAIFGVLGALFLLAAAVPFEELSKNLASYIKPLKLDRLFEYLSDEKVQDGAFRIGVLLVMPILGAVIHDFVLWVKRKIGSAATEVVDHWAERERLEISVIANVSAGREPTDVPINKDPENSRFRELKDAIDTGNLDSDLHGDCANFMSTVTLKDFELYVAATNKPHWIEVLHRWQKVQNPAPDKPSDELKEKRIPLLKFLEIARSRGWNVLEPSGYEGYDLLHGISEGAGLGDITLLGKTVNTQLQSFTATGRLKRIPSEFWSNHEIDPMTCFEYKNPGVVVGLKSNNLETQTKHDGGTFIALGNYADLHIETDGLLDWLKTDAESSRGHHQRTYGD